MKNSSLSNLDKILLLSHEWVKSLTITPLGNTNNIYFGENFHLRKKALLHRLEHISDVPTIVDYF